MKHTRMNSACGACCTELKHLSVQFEGLPVLEDVSLHLHCGEMTAIIGPNGAGKSTLFKAILRQVPYRGEIHFRDAAGGRVGQPRIGYVPQHLDAEATSPVTVQDLLGAALGRRPAFLPIGRKTKEKVRKALSITGVEQLLTRRVGTLSGGETQRMLLAAALTPMPDLLLLDEPVSGIDAEGLIALYQTLDTVRREMDISILMISHDFQFVRRYADRAVLLHHRVLQSGAPDTVVQSDAFAALFPGYIRKGEDA